MESDGDKTKAHVALTGGTMVSHYRIVEKIGAGGMGEVWLAEDTKLNRKVALKFLPMQVAADNDLKARFTREAQAAAALKHPNIVTIHEVGEHLGRPFFAMEYVEGESLRDLMKKQELGLARVVDLAGQICEGLAIAHQAGITHRDIKPSNVCIDSDGRAKILDFGLAAVQGGEHLTQTGSTLGTIGYMSPEQAEGKEIDQRSDIFSLGVILYEMITGRRPFERDNQVATIQAIITATPEPLARYKSNVPDDLQRIVSKLIAKDPASRYQHIDEVPVDLRAIDLSAPTISHVEATPPVEQTTTRSRRLHRALPWGIAVLLAVVAVWALTRTPTSSPRQVARLALALPESAPLSSATGGAVLAVSPDGSRLVYVADVGNTTELHLREISKLQTRPLPGTRGVRGSFFSPDGQWVGFFAGGELKKLYLDGGKPLVLCESKLAMDGSWGTDDTIFFTPAWNGGLWKISADGGDPVQVTTPAGDEFGHWGARVLPGGEGVLFMIWKTSLNDCETALLDRRTGKWRSLATGAADARYVPTGHILYAQSGTIVAAPFDLERLEIGEPHVPVLTDVNQSLGSGQVPMVFSRDGLLYYVRGGAWVARRRLVWVDRQGESDPLSLSAAAFSEPRLSPDGRRLAFVKFEDGAYHLWVHELGSERTTQLTFESSNYKPVWTPDGEWLSFVSYRNGPFDMFQIRADRSQPEEALLTSPNDQYPGCWSPDGQTLLFGVDDPHTMSDIWLLSVQDKDNPRPLIQTSASEGSACFHPTGRWIAYVSDQSGRDEVFVQSFPDPGGVIQISADGGSSPRWSRDGRELFFRCGDKIMAVDIRTGLRFEAGSPRELFEGKYRVRSWDVSADGRFIMVKPDPDNITENVVVVFNWFEELNRLVPIDD